ncbi:MAG: hypothetical protein IT561_26465, partial [Alphaproteobacteria bacterium]|nr:hypothetical protein [Alphaproteobacteria bacterium]
VEGALAQVHRNSTWFILSFRFIYGVRNFASFSLGMARVQPLRFAALNFVAAFVWAGTFVGAGLLFGEAFETLAGQWFEGVGLALLGVIALAIVLAVLHSRRHRRRRHLTHLAADASKPPVI